MTVQDQYLESIRQTQETWAGAVEYFTKDLQRSIDPKWNPFAFVDPTNAIDQLFDFWEKTLAVQRDVAKQLASAIIAAGEQAREQAESANAAMHDQAESANAAMHDQAESANAAMRKQAAAAGALRVEMSKTYDELTKAELQEELAKRELPKTGNVDELRERLVADDQL